MPPEVVILAAKKLRTWGKRPSSDLPDFQIGVVRSFEDAVNSSNVAMRSAAAIDAHIPVTLLRRLALDRAHEVRRAAARNPRASAEDLTALLEVTATLDVPSEQIQMRWAVSFHPNCPDELLAKLAGDPSSLVRGGVASSPKIKPDLVLRLTSSGDLHVLHHLAANPSVPAAVKASLGVSRKPPIQIATLMDKEMNGLAEWGVVLPTGTTPPITRPSLVLD